MPSKLQSMAEAVIFLKGNAAVEAAARSSSQLADFSPVIVIFSCFSSMSIVSVPLKDFNGHEICSMPATASLMTGSPPSNNVSFPSLMVLKDSAAVCSFELHLYPSTKGNVKKTHSLESTLLVV